LTPAVVAPVTTRARIERIETIRLASQPNIVWVEVTDEDGVTGVGETYYVPGAVEAVRQRLAELAASLDGRDYLVDLFSAADILMVTVLRLLRHTDLLDEQRALVAYEERCEARPAFAKALAGQMAAFTSDER